MLENNSLFDKAFDFVIGNEGFYVNNPNDSGGETKWGISKKSFPNLDIKNLTKEQAKAIYKNGYWKREYDLLSNRDLAIRVFDMGVNSGTFNAEMTLQKAINHCGGNIVEDGDIGQLTLKEANLCHAGWLIERFRVERSKYYADCVQKRPKDLDFLKGWIFRNYL